MAVKPETRVRIGDALAALGRKIGLTNEDIETFDRVKDRMPAEPHQCRFRAKKRADARALVIPPKS
jgi:plasmid stability protein